MKRSDEINQIASALSLAQMEIKNPEKDTESENGKGDKFKSAPMSAYFDAVKVPYGKNGLSYFQDLSIDEERKRATCSTLIMHSSGQWIESDPMTFHYNDNTPEDRGLCIGLVKRHSFSAAVGIAAQNEVEEGSKPKREMYSLFNTAEERRIAKQQVEDDLEMVKAAGTPEDLKETWAKHQPTVDKLAMDDPQFIVDLIRKKKEIEDMFSAKADNAIAAG